jgi:hypothetical protein
MMARPRCPPQIWSNLNFVFRLSLEFYRLRSSSVEAGGRPERSEADLKTARTSRLAEISDGTGWSRQLRPEPSGVTPGRLSALPLPGRSNASEKSRQPSLMHQTPHEVGCTRTECSLAGGPLAGYERGQRLACLCVTVKRRPPRRGRATGAELPWCTVPPETGDP